MECFKKYWTYILAFILLGFGLFYMNRAYGYENFHTHLDIQSFYSRVKVYKDDHPVQRQDYQMLYKHHKTEGQRCYDEAKERCWWLPNIEERKKAQYCITNAGIMAAPADPRSKIIAAIVNTLVQYGLDCNDEWHYINNKFYWAQYHFEMAEFYAHMLTQI